MRNTLALAAAIALAATIGSVSASAQSAKIDGVTAVPMASGELDAVKGMHDHWFTPDGERHAAGQPPEGHKFHCERGEGCGVPAYNGICVAVDVGNLTGARPCP